MLSAISEAELAGGLPLSERGLAPRLQRPTGPALLENTGHSIILVAVFCAAEGLHVVHVNSSLQPSCSGIYSGVSSPSSSRHISD